MRSANCESSIYTAGPLGFFEAGRVYHNTIIVPTLTANGFLVLDPWPNAADHYTRLPDQSGRRSIDLQRTNHAIGLDNVNMIRSSDLVLAILDGSDVDSGTAAEIGYAAALSKPIVGVRTDLRMAADNVATAVNLQIAHFIEMSGGAIVSNLATAVDLLTTISSRRRCGG